MIPPHIRRIIEKACECRRSWTCWYCVWLKENEEKYMSQQFPLLTKYMPGLNFDLAQNYNDSILVIDKARLESELAKGHEVWTHSKADMPRYWGPHENNAFGDTHEALVIGSRPIAQESAEDLLRELAREYQYSNREDFMRYERAKERARAFLARSKA